MNRTPDATGRDLITDAALFRLLGVPRVIALDHSEYEGAEIIHDLNKPIPQSLLDFADFIVDGSTLDNVFDPAMVIRNFARMLKPGGRLMTVNMYSNHYEPYAILSPLWYLDFFVINGFVDCKVYILVIPDTGINVVNVFVINTDYLLDPARFVSAFVSPHMMGTIVIAEKGPRSTSEVVPTQQHYRSDAEWTRYRQNLLAMSRDSRPHSVRSLGDISFFDVRSGHLFMANDFTARDPLTEIRRLQKR